MKTSIQFDEQQEKAIQQLIAECASIELVMSMEVDITAFNEIESKLNKLSECFAGTGKMMQTAASFYNTAKGIVANEAMSTPNILDLKQDIQRSWMSGKLARAEGIYARVETLLKDLRNQTMGLQTILSFEKERLKTFKE